MNDFHVLFVLVLCNDCRLSGNVKPKLVTKGNSSEEDEDEDEGLTEEERGTCRFLFR